MKEQVILAIKGALMGAANVIPGVSGGTVALLTGIFEDLILALKSFDLTALNLLRRGQIKAFCEHTRLGFLGAIGVGLLLSILSLARLLGYLFDHYALHVWSLFFGLILASVYFVAIRIRRIEPGVVLLFLAGTAVALSVAFMRPASENAAPLYLFVCGVVAICAMILPGLSGSYVLLLMGNYQLVVIDGISHLKLGVLIPFGLGAAIGLVLFARFLAWVFARYHDRTLALMTGFVFGSLGILWPWKTAVTQTFMSGARVKEKVIGYDYAWPVWNGETALALVVMAMGVGLIIFMEQATRRRGLAE